MNSLPESNFKEQVDLVLKERKAKMEQKKNLLVNMQPAFAEALKNTNHLE